MSTSPPPRQTRLKPEFAELYPALESGRWIPAAEAGARLLRWIAGGGALPPMGSRLLSEEHFEFRGGETGRSLVARRSRREDVESQSQRALG